MGEAGPPLGLGPHAPLPSLALHKTDRRLQPRQHRAKPVEMSGNSSFATWKEMLLFTYQVGRIKEDIVSLQPGQEAELGAGPRAAGEMKTRDGGFQFCSAPNGGTNK